MNGFLKQPQQLPGRYLNTGVGMTVVGGALTTAPAGIGSQGMQDFPGDRMILDSADALALSDTTVSTLYGGLYQYVGTKSDSTANPTRGRLAFWTEDSAAVDPQIYEVDADEDDFIAGVFISTPTKGNYWWIQIAGQVDAFFVSTVASPAQGAGAYAARLGAGADVGGLTQHTVYAGASEADVDQMLNRYMGQAVVLPVASTATAIMIPMARIRF